MKTLPKAFKYLIWPGLMLLTAGIVVGVLNGWTGIAVTFLIAGLLLLVIGTVSGGYATGQFWTQRSTQAGTNALVSVFSVILILALINFIAARYDSRVDLTEGQLLTLSPASQEVVASLESPAEVLLFSPVPNPSDEQLLENYRRYNSDFTYRYVDPNADPQLARQVGVTTVGEVFLKSGDRTVLVQSVNPQETLTERQLTNKLAQLSQGEVAVAYFLQGHDEYTIDGSQAGFFEAANRLQEQNYTVAPLNLANTSTVPPDADVVIIARPQTDFFENEIIAIRDYLNAGGSLMLLVDPQDDIGLQDLLDEWGVTISNTIVIDTSGGGQLVGLGPAAPLVQTYGDHPITAAFGSGRSFFPVVQPLEIQDIANVEDVPLLFTDPNSYVQPLTEGEIAVEPNQEPEGPFAIGVALSRPAVDSTEDTNLSEAGTPEAETPEAEISEIEENSDALPSAEAAIEDSLSEDEILGEAEDTTGDARLTESRMVVIGNSSFATDGLFSQQLNGDVFLNSVDWLSKIDNPVLSIRPKEVTNRRIEMTLSQQVFLTLLALVIFPLLGIIGAGTLWIKRR